MESIYSEEREQFPTAIYNPAKGELKIEGKMIPENVEDAFRPIYRWIEKHFSVNNSLHLLFRLHFYNTSSSRQFFIFFRKLDEYHAGGKIISVRWEYEEGDEESKSDALDFLTPAKYTYQVVEVKE